MGVNAIINKVGRIESFILDDDIKIYYKYASMLKSGENIVDIGTGWGKSAAALALSNPQAVVWTYDPGDYLIDKNVVHNHTKYIEMILRTFDNLKIKNIKFQAIDAMQADRPVIARIVHFDLNGDSDYNTQCLFKKWSRHLCSNGVVLVRNYHLGRSEKKMADIVFKNYKNEGQEGYITVFRKP